MTAADPPFDAGRVTVDETVDAAEVAARLSVSHGTVRNWRWADGNGFPAPLRHVGQSPLWVWADVEAWARRTGRLKEDGDG